MADSERQDTLRILVATDCHLGYMEKDEIRRHDSFQSFEEICSIAEQKEVDFMLLGGDLFHENKPSRSTLVKGIEILRRHCLNDRPVQFQVVSDQTVNFANSFGHVNYEDPHFNVGLPVFSIHGNHDDPAGVDNLSAVDILSACNLVNYFGKMVLEGSGVGQITLWPILIRKGSTAVALYGLGNIRDERLNRMFQTPHAVQWMRPEVQEGCTVSDWFNILVLHQNRVKTNPKNAINEHFLPRFMDFVVWGHEHECLVDPQEVSGMGFHITQPGSSVATSLIEGESKPKHVLLLEIKGNQYRPTKIPLTSVRPFEYTEVVLKDEPGIDANDQNSILERLDEVVNNLIQKAHRKATNHSELKLPLVRVKVDYSGFMTINPQRFGQKYVGKVANPQDILIFSKASKKSRSEATIDNSERLCPEELNQQNIEALVAEHNLKMDILPVNDLDVALHEFVNKDDKLAFYNCVQYNLGETRKKISKDSDSISYEEEDLVVKVGECLQNIEAASLWKSKKSVALTCTSSCACGTCQGEVPAAEECPRINVKCPLLIFTVFSHDSRGNSSGFGNAASFSDDDDTTYASTRSATRGQKRAAMSRGGGDRPPVNKTKTTRGRGRGRGSANLRQTSLDASLGFRQSQRSASAAAVASVRSIAENEEDVDSGSSEEYRINEVGDDLDNEGDNTQGAGQKRAAGRGRGREPTSKRGRSSKSSSTHGFFLSNNDDEEEEERNAKRRKSQPRVPKNYSALRR